jgi:hypothetical protein
MIRMELAVAHGYARIRVKGHHEKRNADLRRTGVITKRAPGDNDLAALARDMQALSDSRSRFGSAAGLYVPGPSPDGPLAIGWVPA